MAATTMEQIRAGYSDYGSRIDIAAPGGDITQDYTADGFVDGIFAYGGDSYATSIQGRRWLPPRSRVQSV